MSFAHTSQERTLGRYSVIAALGRGGMANVYLAVAAGLASFNKLLVLKALRPDSSHELVQMFLDEARLSACFNHPNIVQAYEVGQAAGRYFIALEYLEGQSLRAVQRKLGHTFPVADELRVLAVAARGLDYAHQLKDFEGRPLQVVHRDVSPQNVFLTYDGQVKLLDFGIAKSTISQHHTQVEQLKGKLDYMAPEQARGDAVDRRADVFALGVMAWEAVTRQPFAGGRGLSDVAKLHKRLTGAEPDVRTVRPDVPEPLAQLIRRALSLDPAQRFQTAGAFADAIETFLESSRLRASSKSLSDALARPYAEVRTRLRAVIEAQLRRIGRDGSRDTSLLVLEPGDATSTHYSVRKSLRADSIGPGISRSLAPSEASPARSRMRPHLPKLAVLVGAVALAALSALTVPRRGLERTHSASASAAPLAAVSPDRERPVLAPVSPPARASLPTVIVDVRVSPADARVKLDDAALPELPFHAQLQRDGLVHRVVARAPGYVTKTVAVPFDRDRALHVVLERDLALPLAAPAQAPRVRATEQWERTPASTARSERELRAPAAVHAAPVEPGASIAPRRHARLAIDLQSPYDD